MYESETTARFPGITWKLVVTVCVIFLGVHTPSYVLFYSNNLYYPIKNEHSNGTTTGETFDEHKFDWIFAALNGIVPFGAIIGSVAVKLIADSQFLGVKRGIILHSTISSLGSVCAIISLVTNQHWLTIVSRFIWGLSIGIGEAMVGMFLCEISPPRYRGSIGSMEHVGFTLLATLSLTLTIPEILGKKYLRWIAMLIPLGASVLQLLGSFWMYDSPRQLLYSLIRPNVADKAIQFYQGTPRIAPFKRELNLESSREIVDFRLRDLWDRPTLRTPLLLCIILVFAVTFSGVYPFLLYSQSIYMQAGLSVTLSTYATIGVGLSALVPAVIVIVFADRFGRRRIIITGLALSVLLLSTMTVLLCGLHYGHWPKVVSYSFIACSYALVMASSLSMSLMWAVSCELFPQGSRAAAIMFITLFLWIFRFLQIVFFLPLANLIGIQFIFLPNILLTLVSTVPLALYLPETKQRTFLQIIQGFSPKFGTTRRKISIVYNFKPKDNLHKGYQSDQPDMVKERQPFMQNKARGYGSISSQPDYNSSKSLNV